MIKITNTSTGQTVVLGKDKTLDTLLIISLFDISEGIDITRLEDGAIDADSLLKLCEAGIVKSGRLSNKIYYEEPDSTRYFINPLIAYFLHQEFSPEKVFITRELSVEATMHPLTFCNESYRQFWEFDDLRLPEIHSTGVEEYNSGIEAVSVQINEYLRKKTEIPH